MMGETEESNAVREYFIKLREFVRDNQHLISQAIQNKQKLHKYAGFHSIYFFAAKKNSSIFKLGKSKNIVTRLSNYNTGRIQDIDLDYFALVVDQHIVETCLKDALKNYQKIKNREIYQVDPNLIKRIITRCYKATTSKKDNRNLYREIADLFGMYVYTKNNPSVKPYIVLDKHVK